MYLRKSFWRMNGEAEADEDHCPDDDETDAIQNPNT
jgi:hypothetical protein